MNLKEISHMTNNTVSTQPTPTMIHKGASILWYIITLLFLELCISLGCFQSIASFPYISITSISLGLLITASTSLKNHKVNYILSLIITFILVFIYLSEMLYYKIFGTFFTLASLTMAGDAAQYNAIMFKVIAENWLLVSLMFLPFVITLFKPFLTRKYYAPKGVFIGLISLLIYFILFICLTTGFLIPDKDYDLYNKSYLPTTSLETFGGVISLQFDIKQLLGFTGNSTLDSFTSSADDTSVTPDNSNYEATPDANTSEEDTSATTEETVITYAEQILNIDFTTLAENEADETIASLHTYFAQADTQNQNEYTGLFEGQNLIFITAESFSHYCIDEELTPTLYKLYSEGFQFTDFYTPGWSVSTTDGEYVALTGLIPKSGVRSFTEAADNYLPFTMGLQTTAYEYSPIMAYHNHTYDYYSRDLSHPNMGYEYKALGLGLDITPTWPESDLEMMELTTDDYIYSDEPFHAYYMTVSGHQLYTFTGNSMSAKNQELTEHLDYSESVRAYLAANIELDLALEHLLEELEAVGKLDNTVIVLSADHYPYGLTNEELSEMNGETVDPNYGIYQNALLIWSGSMEEPIVVDKPAQSLDIIPTISNLMGFNYDSRLLMGNDILGDDYEPLIIFSDRSFITEEGYYNTSTGEFTENEGADEVTAEYIQEKSSLIDLKFELSELILDYDYYSLLPLEELLGK